MTVKNIDSYGQFYGRQVPWLMPPAPGENNYWILERSLSYGCPMRLMTAGQI